MELLRNLWEHTLLGAPILIFAAACVVSAVLYAAALGCRAAMSRSARGRVRLPKLEGILRRLRLIDSA